MFLHLSISHSVHMGGGCLPQCMLGYTPPRDQRQTVPPVQCMVGDTGNKPAVRILLECILVTFVLREKPELRNYDTNEIFV